MNPRSHAILARQLVSENGSDSFEGFWGDSSGEWGDFESEDFLALDVAITLSNNYGSVILAGPGNEIPDEVTWETASDDGRSIERTDVDDIGSGWHDCFDPDGSTPGRVNSSIPPEGGNSFIVEIKPVVISVGDGGFDDFKIDVVIPPAAELSVKIYDETGYRVRSLLENSGTAVQQISWDGKNDHGHSLPPGIYIISFGLSGRSNRIKNCPVVIAP